jgi:hypothetical protein
MRKLPPDAFDFYFAQGPGRSYAAVAKEYGASKRAVVNLANREGWRQRISSLERQARERVEAKAVESLEAMQSKHLKTLQVVLGKALETLRAQPLETAMEAVRAIEMVIKQERAARGEPKDQDAINVEAIIKREYALLMVADGEEERDAGEDRPSGHQAPQ